MTDDSNATPATPNAEPDITPIEAAPPLPEDNDVGSLPDWAQKRFKELNRENMTRRKAESDRAAAQRVKDQKALEEQGKYKQLSETFETELLELRPVKEAYDKRLEDDKERNAKRIETLPEHAQSIVPTDYSPAKLSGWLDENIDKIVKPVAPDIDAGAGVGNSRAKTVVLSAEQKQMAKNFNMTEDQYAEHLNS